MTNLKKVIHANYAYCLKGDNTFYRQLLQASGATDHNLKRFEEKFMPFFVEDFRWTEHNYDNMLKRSEQLRRWWEAIKPLRDLSYLGLKSVDDFLYDLREAKDVPPSEGGCASDATDQFIDKVWVVVFEKQVRPVLQEQAVLLPQKKRTQRAFTRWMAGQLAICAKFHFLEESKQCHDCIMSMLLQYEKEGMDLDTVNSIRQVYEEYLSCLVDKSLISKDDEVTFAELYPLFDPFYVSYDRDTSSYEELSQVSKRIFSLETHREKQFLAAAYTINRSLTPKEKDYLSSAALMVEAGEGRIDGGLFVSKPGVLFLAHTHWGSNDSLLGFDSTQVTFLVSGIALETSLELVAHKEARVARLTSSKTLAMNLPLFRVQGDDLQMTKRYLESVLKHRTIFEEKNQPRKKVANGNELFNMTLPACKATALCYSMTLKEYHSLFIGRMGPNGNEEEVREVVRKMASQLNQRFPNHILPPQTYLNFNNAEKYKSTQPSHHASLELKSTDNSPLVIKSVAHTVLSTEAKELFSLLKINTEQPDYMQLSEFRSRITYLAFPSKEESRDESAAYLKKMTEEFGHLSILAGVQVGLLVSFLSHQPSDGLLALLAKFGAIQQPAKGALVYLLLTTLKDIHQLLLQMSTIDKITTQALSDYAHQLYPAVIRSAEFYCSSN